MFQLFFGLWEKLHFDCPQSKQYTNKTYDYINSACTIHKMKAIYTNAKILIKTQYIPYAPKPCKTPLSLFGL